jgi:2-oxoglutarate dehydrogenase E1 component
MKVRSRTFFTRMERYPQMCATDNMFIADCTTPANFYLFVEEDKMKLLKPLIVFYA